LPQQFAAGRAYLKQAEVITVVAWSRSAHHGPWREPYSLGAKV
jgi:hypothetical protein